MRELLNRVVRRTASVVGITPVIRFWQSSRKNRELMKEFINDYKTFVSLSKNSNSRFEMNWKDRFPCLNDKNYTNDFDAHYVYHTAWAARVLKKINPDLHIDISSSIYFNAIVSAFIPIEYYEFDYPRLLLNGLKCNKADLVSLPFPDNTVESLSCMHTIEHVGLGRYGDHMDYDGDIKAIGELKRVLKRGGNLLIVVPVGRPRIVYNAHRIYSVEMIFSFFSEFELVEFTLIPDNAHEMGLIINADSQSTNIQNYGCGCFWFKK